MEWLKAPLPLEVFQHLLIRLQLPQLLPALAMVPMLDSSIMEAILQERSITASAPIIDLERTSSLLLRTSRKIRWSQLILISVLEDIMRKNLIISKTQSCFSKCLGLITSYWGLCSRQMVSVTLSLTSGTSCGAQAAARAIFMKVWMSSKRSIISLRATK